MRGTKRQATEALAEFAREARRGMLVDRGHSFGELLDHWLSTTDVAPTTLAKYRQTTDAHLRPVLGAVALERLRPADLEAFLAGLRPLGVYAVRRAYDLLSIVLGLAVRLGWLATSPMPGVTPPKVRRREITPPTPEVVGRLLAHASEVDPPLATWLRLAVVTGARRGELCALRWADVDLDGLAVTISGSLARIGGALVRKETKTERPRVVAIDAETADTLRDMSAGLAPPFPQVSVNVSPDKSYVFAWDDGRPWSPDGTGRRVATVCAELGIKGVRVHDLRHYVATQLLGAGVDVRTVANRLGHAQTSTTLNTYAAAIPARDRTSADLLAGLIVTPGAPRGTAGGGSPLSAR
jgi:integrase